MPNIILKAATIYAPTFAECVAILRGAGRVRAASTVGGAAAIALTGTAVGGVDENTLPGLTVIATITDATWAATLGQNNQLTADALAGITSAQSETHGWNNEVRDNLIYGDLVRTSDHVATLTLPTDGRLAAYDITAQETVTWTFPANAFSLAAVYSTSFPLTENPISESGAWHHTDPYQTVVQTGGGMAYGTQVGGTYEPYDDSAAYLTGFGTDYEIEGIIHVASSLSDDPNREVELLLRWTDDNAPRDTAYGWTQSNGYEITIHHNGLYMGLGRFKGDGLYSVPSPPVPANGDHYRARIEGQRIRCWWNDVLKIDYTDDDPTYQITSGNPGIGFFIRPGAAHTDFALTDVAVTAL